MKNRTTPDPHTLYPIKGCDKEINNLIPLLTSSDLETAKEERRARR